MAWFVALVLVVSCSSDGSTETNGTSPASSSTTTTTTVPVREGNGSLSIGVLLPTTGPGAQLGGPMINAVRLAVNEINAAGGVLGSPVELIEADEGGTISSAAIGLDTLLASDVDAIVGPASSLVALAQLDRAVSAGVLTCSPTTTALSLDEFPDNGLFFRTVPSDSLQAVAIAAAAELTGARDVSIAYLDDGFGRGLASAVERALEARNLSVVTRRGLAVGETDTADFAEDALAGDPGVVVVLGDSDAGTRMLTAFDRELVGRPIPRVLVNDAVRAARSSQPIVDLSAELRSEILGLAPLAISADRPDLPGPYAGHAYDCVTLIALAAERAGTDTPNQVANQMAAVSVSGSVCNSFAGCLDRLEDGLLIDYNGPSGRIELSSRTGDPTRARFEVFTFDEDGRDVSGTWFEVTAL